MAPSCHWTLNKRARKFSYLLSVYMKSMEQPDNGAYGSPDE